MVAGFRRSSSFSTMSPSRNPAYAKRRTCEKSFHLRSASFPCQLHPLISQVEEHIRAVEAWQPHASSTSTSSAGLALLEILYSSVDDLLQLPQSQDSLRRGSTKTERLLDEFLLLADAYSNFRIAIVALKELQVATQVSIRRWDEDRVSSCVKSQRRVEKEIVKLATSLQKRFRHLSSAITLASVDREAELGGILTEVILVTLSTSASIFSCISTASSSATTLANSTLKSRDSWMVGPLKRLSSFTKKEEVVLTETQRMSALQCLEGVEECLNASESKSERVFKILVNARVSLLNALTL